MVECKLRNIDSIILSVTCHSLIRNFPPIIHIPLYPFMFFETLQVIFFEFESFVNG